MQSLYLVIGRKYNYTNFFRWWKKLKWTFKNSKLKCSSILSRLMFISLGPCLNSIFFISNSLFNCTYTTHCQYLYINLAKLSLNFNFSWSWLSINLTKSRTHPPPFLFIAGHFVIWLSETADFFGILINTSVVCTQPYFHKSWIVSQFTEYQKCFTTMITSLNSRIPVKMYHLPSIL